MVTVFKKNSIKKHQKRRRVARIAFGISVQLELNKKPPPTMRAVGTRVGTSIKKNSIRHHRKRRRVATRAYDILFKYEYNKKPPQTMRGV